MIYRISGGLFLAFFGLQAIGLVTLPAVLLGILALVAGIALLAGK